MSMALNALGIETDEDTVNKVMGALPMKGAAWENALACSQHFGCRATLTTPSTIKQVKGWTDAGIPVMIAWNPEGREWSHASLVYDVTNGTGEVPPEATLEGEGAGFYVWVADPNIPHPDKTTRIVHEDLFYKRWYEKWPQYLVRRPACAIDREITPEGRQVMATSKALAGVTTFDWRSFAQDLASTLRSQVRMPLHKIEGKEYPTIIRIYTSWGWDYFEDRRWDDKELSNVIKKKKHGLTGLGHEFKTPDGKELVVDIGAHTNAGRGLDRFAADQHVDTAINREVDSKGRQRVASTSKTQENLMSKESDKDAKSKVGPSKGEAPKQRNVVVQQLIERGGAGAGKHLNRDYDVQKGKSRKPKHRNRDIEGSISRIASRFEAAHAKTIEEYATALYGGKPVPLQTIKSFEEVVFRYLRESLNEVQLRQDIPASLQQQSRAKHIGKYKEYALDVFMALPWNRGSSTIELNINKGGWYDALYSFFNTSKRNPYLIRLGSEIASGFED
jgi:hypothetical protein